MSGKSPRNWRAIGAGALRASVGVVAFPIFLLLGLVIHLNLPGPRAALKGVVEDALADILEGTIRLGEIESIGAFGVTAREVEANDPWGRRVVSVQKLKVGFDVFAFVRRTAAFYEKWSVVIDEVKAEEVQLLLVSTKAKGKNGEQLGHASLRDTFTPKESTTPGGEGPSREMRLWFAKIAVRDVHVREELPGLPVVEVVIPEADSRLLVTDAGVALDVHRFGLTVAGLGGSDATAEGSLELRIPGAISGDVRGTLGTIPFSEEFRIERGHWLIDGTLPHIEGGALKAMWSPWPLDGTVALTHHLDGVYPDFHVDGKLTAGEGTARLNGRVKLGAEPEGDLDLDVDRLDLSRLKTSLPQSELTVRAAAEVWLQEGKPRFELNGTVLPGLVANEPVPAVDLKATLSAEGLHAFATVHERGLPVHIDVKKLGDAPLEFGLVLAQTRLEEIPRLTKLVPLRGGLSGEIRGKIEKDRVTTDSTLRLAAFGYGDISAKELLLDGTSNFSFTEPRNPDLALTLRGKGISRNELSYETLRLDVAGPLKMPHLKIAAKRDEKQGLKGEATIRTDRLELTELKAEVQTEGKPISISGKRAAFVDGRLSLDTFAFESEGRMTANVDMSEFGGSAEIKAEKLNLGRIAKFLGEPEGKYAGQLSADVDVNVGERSQGTIDFSLENGRIAGVGPAKAKLNLTFEGKTVSGKLTDASFGDRGSVDSEFRVTLHGSPLRASSYERSLYDGRLSFSNVDLGWFFSEYGPESDLALGGVLKGTIDVKKTEERSLPEIHLDAKTDQLTASVPAESSPLEMRGAELDLSANVQPSSDQVSIALRVIPSQSYRVASSKRTKTVRKTPSQTDFLAIGGTLSLPLAKWGRGLPASEELKKAVLEAPISATFVLPERSLSSWDEVVRLPAISGSLSGRGLVQGSFLDPRVYANLNGKNITSPSYPSHDPISFEARVEASPLHRTLNGDVTLGQARESSDGASAQVTLGTASFAVGISPDAFAANAPPDRARWNGSAQLLLEGAPLDLVPFLAERRLDGRVQGSILLERDGFLPELKGNLRITNLRANGKDLGNASLSLETFGPRLLAKANASDSYGTLELQGESEITATPWFFGLDPKRPSYFTLRADQYNTAVLQPFLRDTLRDFQGSLDGTLRAEVSFVPTSSGHELDARLSGKLHFKDGRITLTMMGLPLEDASFDIVALRQGPFNILELNDFRARARSDTPNIRGRARLFFTGFAFTKGDFQVSQEELPVLSEGVKLADITGNATGTIENGEKETKVEVEVPELFVELPTITSRRLIELEENSSISVLEPLAAPKKASDENPSRLELGVTLGKDVRVENDMMSLKLKGRTDLTYEEELTIRGRIELVPGGRVQVLSRAFIIDEGSVLFDAGDPANPDVDVTATWRAPNGTLVRATVTGPAKEPELKWSSDPPLAGGETAVVALVLGGTGDARSSDTGGAGLTYGAAMVNQVLGQSGIRGVEISASRQSQNNGRQVAQFSNSTWDNYAAAFQLNEQIWFEGAYQKETNSSPGTVPRSGFSGSLDWRFRPEWSARTEVGSLGVGLDLLWQYRY